MHKPSIIALTETWIRADHPDVDLYIPNYSLHRCDRTSSQGGGCAIYSHSSLLANRIDDSDMSILDESLWIAFSSCGIDYILGCVYMPPSSFPSLERKLIQTLDYVSLQTHPIKIIMGDFNLPGIDWTNIDSSRPIYEHLLTNLLALDWRQHITVPTRGEATLDLMLTHGAAEVICSIHDPIPGSDHYSIVANVYAGCNSKQRNSASHAHRKVDWTNLDAAMRDLQVDDIIAINDVDVSVRRLHTVLTAIYKRVAYSSMARSRQPDHSTISRRFSAKMDKLSRSYHKQPDISTLLTLHTVIKDACLSNQRALQSQESNAANNSSKLVKLFRQRTKYNALIPKTMTLPDKTQTSDPHVIADSFASFFASSMCEESSQPLSYVPSEQSKHLFSVAFTNCEVNSAITRLKPSTYPGPDGLPADLFKKASKFLAPILCQVFHDSLKLMTFPDAWKTSIITPRHKSGPRYELHNYRPIHHTSVCSRIMERVINDSLLQHLSSSPIHPSQHGFISRRSCITCEISFLNLVTLS
ncbi:MAG: endonuclease/exonuclease/phosphatase family protein, partial [Aeromonas sp.]